MLWCGESQEASDTYFFLAQPAWENAHNDVNTGRVVSDTTLNVVLQRELFSIPSTIFALLL